MLGLGWLDALYQTVTTVATVGFREYGEVDAAWKAFTLVLIVTGVGTALYTLGALLEDLVEGRVSDRFGRRRMERRISALGGHVVVCGSGRVGRTAIDHLRGAGHELVVVDRDAVRAGSTGVAHVVGDATDDSVLVAAGLPRASVLVAALASDAENLYVTLSARSARPDLFIVARARDDASEAKLFQAGADRVVNPQHIGGARMAALAVQPAVAEFLDVVMHDGTLEFRLAEVPVPEGSPAHGATLRELRLRERTGALILAIRASDGTFETNPGADSALRAGRVLIAIGTEGQLGALRDVVSG